jgi:hypothetical protein
MENPFLQNALVTFSSLLGLVGATVFWAIALRRQGPPDMRNAVGV